MKNPGYKLESIVPTASAEVLARMATILSKVAFEYGPAFIVVSLLFIAMSIDGTTAIIVMDNFPMYPWTPRMISCTGISEYLSALVTDLAVASVHSAANYKSNSSPYSCSYDC